MSVLQLPERPSLEHLKNQARALLSNGDTTRFAEQKIAQPKLADALHVIAREYGFPTWAALKLHVELASGDAVSALVAALKADDADSLRQVLAKHPHLRATIDEPLPGSDFDEPALLAAVHKQNRAMIDALLDFGADIDARSRWWAGGFGVLDFAGPELAAHLIRRGATVDIHAASRLGLLDRVKQLLAADPELVHARGGDGQLPLHFAATVEIAQVLLDAGAEIDAKDIDHESTALQYLLSSKPERHEVARYLIARGAQADVLAASALGELALVERILNDDPESIRISATATSFPMQNPRSGGSIYLYGLLPASTPHMLARQYGHTAVFDLLMQRSGPSQRLVQAVEIGDEAIAKSILERHPAVVQKLNPLAARRLIGPAVRNNTRAVELLLQYGWPAGPALDNGQTALHFAAWNGNPAMAQALLAHDADVNATEKEHGGSPLGWALHGSLHGRFRTQGDYPGVVRVLLAAGAAMPEGDQFMGTEEALQALR